jgi:hypothetical protein
MSRILLLVGLLLLSGCKDRFRYACQDPDNWQNEECEKPKCIASGYCTEYLITTSEEADEAN